MEGTAKRKPGRPRRPSEEAARIQQSLRMRPSVNALVREEADRNVRSISEELEDRIDRSFEAVVVHPAPDVMVHLMAESKRNGRSFEEEVLHRITASVTADHLRAAVLSTRFIDAIVDGLARRSDAGRGGEPKMARGGEPKMARGGR